MKETRERGESIIMVMLLEGEIGINENVATEKRKRAQRFFLPKKCFALCLEKLGF